MIKLALRSSWIGGWLPVGLSALMLPLMWSLDRWLVADEPLQVGVAEVDITPPNGFPIAGYYHERLAEGTLDPLKAKAMVFRQGTEHAAWVVCDLTAISRDLCVVVRQRVSETTGIPAEAIAVSATHSHTAPDYSKHLFQYLKTPQAERQAQGADQSPYAEKLISGIVQAVVDANQSIAPTKVAVGAVEQQVPVSFNRRFVMKDGSVKTWRNLSDPQVVRAAGPIDPEIGLVALYAETGKLRGVLSNFALHLDTVGGLKWSADYPFTIEQALRQRLGQQVISIFGTGCCGDINHSDPSRRERNKTDFIGQALADTIQSGLPQTRPVTQQDLEFRRATVDLPLQTVTRDQIERSQQLLQLVREGGKVEFLDQVQAYKTLMLAQFRNATKQPNAESQIGWGLSHAWSGIGDTLPVDVQTLCVGDELALVFLPGEVFVELGLAIKRGSPYRHTLIIELSNCVETAYIPTRAACAGGSYEVTNSTVQPGAGEMLVETALRLLRESASSR